MDDFIAMLGDLLSEGWDIYDPDKGPDCILICPCGHLVEQDGQCPKGHVSPMRSLGLI